MAIPNNSDNRIVNCILCSLLSTIFLVSNLFHIWASDSTASPIFMTTLNMVLVFICCISTNWEFDRQPFYLATMNCNHKAWFLTNSIRFIQAPPLGMNHNVWTTATKAHILGKYIFKTILIILQIIRSCHAI